MILNSNDSDPSSRRLNTGRIKQLSHKLLSRVAPLSFLIAAVSIMPVSASGGGLLGAFFEMVTGEEEVVVVERTYNSQTASVLASVASIDPNASYGGGDIVVSSGALVPELGPLGTAANITDIPPQGHISVYVVREGDTLSQIADMFGVSVNTILWANDIKRGVIHKGDTLIILPVSGVKYTVESGDTIESIAKGHEADAGEIALFNDLTINSPLSVGSEIVIPGGEGEEVHLHVFAGEAGKYFMRPIDGGRKSQGIHGYNAVDLATYHGAPIFASAGGRVILSREGGWNGGYGNYIVIEHDNGTQTLYSHNAENIVSRGQWVVQGQVIGYVGSTGRSTGPHVHFEIRGAANPF